jgi:hypothetical protein
MIPDSFNFRLDTNTVKIGNGQPSQPDNKHTFDIDSPVHLLPVYTSTLSTANHPNLTISTRLQHRVLSDTAARWRFVSHMTSLTSLVAHITLNNRAMIVSKVIGALPVYIDTDQAVLIGIYSILR